VASYLNIVLSIVSVALIAIIILQSRGAGLGGLGGGGDFGGAGFHVFWSDNPAQTHFGFNYPNPLCATFAGNYLLQ